MGWFGATAGPAGVRLEELMAAIAAQVFPERSLILRHMPSLDSIRGAAVLMVVLFHGFIGFPWVTLFGQHAGILLKSLIGSGRFGVNVFFVLSGFLITGLLLKARHRPDFYPNFYLRRALRILPAYLLVLAVLWAAHVIEIRFVLAALFFVANFARIFGASLNEYGSLWSLAVEEHFYLLWPTCVRRLRDRTLTRLLVLTVVGEPLLRLAAAHVSAHIDIHYKTPFVLDFVAYGALLSMLIHSGRIHLGNAARIGRSGLAVSALLAILVIWVGSLSSLNEGAAYQALADLPFTWGACGVLLLALCHDHARFERTGQMGARGLLPFFGYISYGLYLINVFIFAELGLTIGRHLPPALATNPIVYAVVVLLCIAVSTLLAYLSRRFFEGPILGLKDRWQSRFAEPSAPPPPPPIVHVAM